MMYEVIDKKFILLEVVDVKISNLFKCFVFVEICYD